MSVVPATVADLGIVGDNPVAHHRGQRSWTACRDLRVADQRTATVAAGCPILVAGVDAHLLGVVGWFDEWSTADAVTAGALAAVLVVLHVWGHRSRQTKVSAAQMRRAYGPLFAKVGYRISDVMVRPIDRELWQLSVLVTRLGSGCTAADAELSATATLVGLNAMDVWPRLTQFEVRLATDGDAEASTPIVVLTRGHGVNARAAHQRHDPGRTPPIGRDTSRIASAATSHDSLADG
jgi:hypothetical protein